MMLTIDRSRYFFVPRTGGRRLLSLARLLGKYKPETASFDVDETAARLADAVAVTTKAYVDRHREYGPSIAAEEAEFDAVTDILFYILRDRVLHWEVFDRPAVRRIAAQQADGDFDYEACIDKAEVAARVRDLLLAQGLEFLRLPYPEQSEHMLTLWTVIEAEQLHAPLTELIGAEFFGALADCRVRYDAMVEQRTARAQGSAVNLKQQLVDLQKATQNYLIALLAMIRDDEPDNVAMIAKALRPVDALRELIDRERARARGALEQGDTITQIDEAAVEELVAEQDALDEQLGIGSGDEPIAEAEQQPQP